MPIHSIAGFIFEAFALLGSWFLVPPGWDRTIFRAVSIGLFPVYVVIGAAHYEAYKAGCYGAPKDVPFVQGMTLCPGQSAHGVFVVSGRPVMNDVGAKGK